MNLKRLLTVAALLAPIASAGTVIWNALEWPELLVSQTTKPIQM